MRKLEEEGFEDIERNAHRGTIVQDLSGRINFRTEVVESTENYYSWALAVTHTKRFRNGRILDRHPGRKAIWRLHAAGKNNSEIGQVVGRSRWVIEDLVKKIRSYLEKK